jgi:signal transduction histidine kinase
VNVGFVANIAALVLNLALGVVVFWTNPRRTTNQFFLLLAVIAIAWILSLLSAFSLSDPAWVAYHARMAQGVSSFAPFLFNCMRLSIIHRESGLFDIIQRSWLWLVLNIGAFALCQTDFFMKGVVFPKFGTGPSTIAEPIYGPGMALYALFWTMCLVRLVYLFAKDLRTSEGIVRTELQFILLGGCAGLVMGVVPAVFFPLFTSSSQSVQLSAPLAIVSLAVVVAYGIATRRIMDVAHLFRLVTAYSLVMAYLIVLYAIVEWPTALLLRHFRVSFAALPHLAAALAVAFSLAPANGWMQRFANRLFVSAAPLDVATVVKSANELLRSVRTVDSLFALFGEHATKVVGTDRILVLLSEGNALVQRHPIVRDSDRLRLAPDDPLPQAFQEFSGPLVAQVLRRLRSSPHVAEACRRLESLRMEAAVGIHSKEGLDCIVLFGPRLSGRIYGSPEQQAMHLLCNQLGVALNNAKLYTEVQDGKIYNDVLLDSLVNGVVAANSEGVVTVFNREAQRITRLGADAVLNHPVSGLPPALAAMLQTTLRQGARLRDQEMALRLSPELEIPIRVGSSIFIGSAGKALGAFLVFSDLTAIKKLEMQVRRTDRLASLGTLSAGMAHEIKNPLVTIKTFTQLLPERYTDTDFRETFFSLIGSEVKRIDSIVNQLLRFSRPAKPQLTPTHLHDILQTSLTLVAQQLRQKGIELQCAFEAAADLIQADSDQLSQAFINFFLNAVESMHDQQGRLAVATAGLEADFYMAGWQNRNRLQRRIQVSIQDSGEGIASENIPHIFDPFFTTKSQGTGLGLSVAHNIIHEHHGTVDVKSEPGQGTTFYIAFPLIEKESQREATADMSRA